jgi:hypothetical protein
MSNGLPVDAVALREEVKSKYRSVAVDPHGSYHFHTDAHWRDTWATTKLL